MNNMREIKFRAWDMYAKKWIEHFNVDLLNIPKFETCVLMQYTGLKDIHGVMIYEGDIVKWIDSDNDIRKNNVFFENGSFRICNSNFEISEYGELEVIGNIYENPELLGDDENVEM